jgi:curved DNA-binding protein CbpA
LAVLNYFDFYGINRSLTIDLKELRILFLNKSREVHPDLAAQDEDSLDLAAFNNTAYNVLKDRYQLISYILELNNIPTDARSVALSNDFLMDMMDINEEIQESLDSQNEDEKTRLFRVIENKQMELDAEVDLLCKSFDEAQDKSAILIELRDCILKKNYFNRLNSLLIGNNEI